MANTFSQMNVQAIFAVNGRENLLNAKIRPRLFEYIKGILGNLNQYPLAVNGYRDHVHIFFELAPPDNVASIVQKVKSNSSRWINENNFIRGHFFWQTGYGSFTYARSQRDHVISYIMNQLRHHEKKTFRKEYIGFLDAFEIEYNPKYLFEFYE